MSTMYFIAAVDSSDEGVLGAAFPDAPGCTAMGKSHVELVSNAITALREWIEDRVGDGLGIPPARTAEELRHDPEFKGADLTYIPLLLDVGRTVRANISIDMGLLEQIDEAAKLRGLTRSAFLASAAREKIAEQR